MKKVLILLTSAILSFTGCQKNEAVRQPQSNGGDENVTFTVSLPDNMTKAVADNDGHGANVNHWIMEVRDVDGDIFSRKEDDAEAGLLTHTFNVTLIKGQTYNVLFWADTKGFYKTDSLTNVKLPNPSGYAANRDSLDAFSAVEANFTTTTAATRDITLKRPFAQLNVIFTDIDTLYKTINDSTEFLKFKPTDFSAKAKVPTSFNVQTQTAGEPATTALNITATTDYKNNYNAHKTESTLFMDYLFATAGSKDIVDIDFSFVSKGVTIAHSFASIPFQRNYRTNIKGDLMSSNAQWNVEVDPVWDSKEDGSEDFVYEVVSDIAGANALIASDIASGKKVISVKFTSQPNDAGAPGDTTSGVVNKAIVTTNLPAEGTLNVLVEAQTKNLYIGDYSSPTDTTLITSGTNAAVINVNVPDGSGIQKLVINAPSKTVYLNGALVASAGVIDCLDIITSNNTLVIEAGQTVKKLIFRQGALKIHGTVVEVAIPDGHGDIYVRDCEGLSQEVYTVLEQYIDSENGYIGEQESGKNTYRIFQSTAYVAKIGQTPYYTLAAAFKAAQDGQTVDVLGDCTVNKTITVDKTVTLNLANHTITAGCSGYLFNLNTTTAGKTFKITGTDKNNCGHIASNGTSGHNGVAVINGQPVVFTMEDVKVHGATEAAAYVGVANNNTTSLFADNTASKDDVINLTNCTINTTSVILGGNQTHSAAASLNVSGGSYTGAKGFRFEGAVMSVIDGATITVDQGIALYPYSDTDLKDSFVYDNATGNTNHDAISIGGDGKVLTIDNTTVNTVSKTAVAAEHLGKAIINSGTFKSSLSSTGAVLRVNTSGGQMVVNGGAFDGSSAKYAVFSNTYAGSAPDDPAGVKIYGGTFTGGNSGFGDVSSDNATIDIYGGNFMSAVELKTSGTQHIWLNQENTAVFESTVNNSCGKIIYAGTFKGAVTTGDNTLQGGTYYVKPDDSKCVSGYVLAVQGTTPETWKVIVDPFAGQVAKIGDKGYATFEAALAAVQAGETIELLDNVSITSPTITDQGEGLSIHKDNVTLDMKNKTLTASNSSSFIIKGEGITVKNGTITCGGNYGIVTYYATDFTLQSVNFTNTGINITYSSTAVFKNCSVTGAPYSAVMVQKDNSKVTIQGGEYKPASLADKGAITLQNGNNIKVFVEGGTFTGNLYCNPYNNVQSGYIYVSEGDFTFHNDKWSSNVQIMSGSSLTQSTSYKDNNNVMWQHKVVSKNGQ